MSDMQQPNPSFGPGQGGQPGQPPYPGQPGQPPYQGQGGQPAYPGQPSYPGQPAGQMPLSSDPPTALPAKEYPQRRIGANGILMFILAVPALLSSMIIGLLGLGAPSTSIVAVPVSFLLFVASLIMFKGIYIQRPNECRVITFFGKYIGFDDREGLRFTAPWNGRDRVSLRLNNFSTSSSKVNDANGNPIMIAAVVVWQVEDPAQAIFSVSDYVNYVEVQAESAVRQVARAFPYDSFDDPSIITLIGDTGEVNAHLQQELQERMNQAGLRIVEARLTDLSYSPEIAEAMLRRQQAAAIVAARAKIVEGAVGMVKDAIELLEHGDPENTVVLDPTERARFATNLMTVITSDTPTSPVVNVAT